MNLAVRGFLLWGIPSKQLANMSMLITKKRGKSMKRPFLVVLIFGFFTFMQAQNGEQASVSEPNGTMSEQQYWQGLFNALQEFKQKALVKTPAFIQELTNLEPFMGTALINAALMQVISHALYVRELRTSEQFSKDLHKTLVNLSQDDGLRKELSRLARMNLDPLWFLGKRTTVEQMAGSAGRDLVRAAALTQIVLKQAERVKTMINRQMLELNEQKKTATLKPIADIRLMNFKTLENYVAIVIEECKKAYEAILQQAQQKINNQAFLQYLQNIGKSISYVPDQAYVEEMEIIGSVAQAIYPSAAYRKYMSK